MPRTAPKTAMITASQRIMARICRRPMPMARSSPISRVRSKIDSARVFTMPIRAMRIARRSRAPMRLMIVLKFASCASLAWALSRTSTLGNGASAASRALRAAAADMDGGFFTPAAWSSCVV